MQVNGYYNTSLIFNSSPKTTLLLESISAKIGSIVQMQNQDQPFENYKEAAQQILDLKKGLNLKSLFEYTTPEVRLNGIRLLLGMVHPYPLSEEIFENERAIFEFLKEQCYFIPTQVALEIEIQHSLFLYNYAMSMSFSVAEEINMLLIAYGSSGAFKQEIFDKITDHFHDEAMRYDAVISDNKVSPDLLSNCYQAVAKCFEVLADTYIACHGDFPNNQIEMLKDAIGLYQKSKRYYPYDIIKLMELEERIQNAQAKLANI